MAFANVSDTPRHSAESLPKVPIADISIHKISASPEKESGW
jgi:hypothetical protein